MKKELVKPTSIKKKVTKEVESLCDGFSCGSFDSWPSGNTNNETQILF